MIYYIVINSIISYYIGGVLGHDLEDVREGLLLGGRVRVRVVRARVRVRVRVIVAVIVIVVVIVIVIV